MNLRVSKHGGTADRSLVLTCSFAFLTVGWLWRPRLSSLSPSSLALLANRFQSLWLNTEKDNLCPSSGCRAAGFALTTLCLLTFTCFFLFSEFAVRSVSFVLGLESRRCRFRPSGLVVTCITTNQKDSHSPSSCLHFSNASSVAYSVLGWRMNILVLLRRKRSRELAI